jgi:nicotinate-nucleotide pyrophosphorylase (carboxylating)
MDLDKEIERLIDRAIEEDIRTGDKTTHACIPDSMEASGSIVLKQAGVVAGIPFLRSVFTKVDPEIEIAQSVEEGSHLKAGTILVKVKGPAQGILSAERTALNLIQHASGIATITARYVKKLVGLNCAIIDTRKTLPGLRGLEKYAVKVGGGHNHRFALDDRFVLKANHLGYLGTMSTDPLLEAFERLKKYDPTLPIEIEIDRADFLASALQTDAKVIILKNMTPDLAKDCIKRIRGSGKKVYIGSSDAITLETVRAYAETGADGVCIGALTHSVEALDIKLILPRSASNWGFGAGSKSQFEMPRDSHSIKR